mgnify:CR=1 FL=1
MTHTYMSNQRRRVATTRAAMAPSWYPGFQRVQARLTFAFGSLTSASAQRAAALTPFSLVSFAFGLSRRKTSLAPGSYLSDPWTRAVASRFRSSLLDDGAAAGGARGLLASVRGFFRRRDDAPAAPVS